MEAQRHHKETEHLAALLEYGALDTRWEQQFDSVTLLLAEICEVPMAATIRATSQIGQGSCFTVCLPIVGGVL